MIITFQRVLAEFDHSCTSLIADLFSMSAPHHSQQDPQIFAAYALDTTFKEECKTFADSLVSIYILLSRYRCTFLMRFVVEEMMYGFGDGPNPLPESIKVMDTLTKEYIMEMVSTCFFSLLLP